MNLSKRALRASEPASFPSLLFVSLVFLLGRGCLASHSRGPTPSAELPASADPLPTPTAGGSQALVLCRQLRMGYSLLKEKLTVGSCKAQACLWLLLQSLLERGLPPTGPPIRSLPTNSILLKNARARAVADPETCLTDPRVLKACSQTAPTLGHPP